MPDTVFSATSSQPLTLFSCGFRPFFLGAALWAIASILIWLLVIAGAADVPSIFDPVSWHAHEFLFGYLGAVVAGFLLTAVPNWTGRKPLAGWPLAALAGVWGAGRICVFFSANLPIGFAAIVDVLFLVLLAVFILREIVGGRNWRNLIVVVLLAVFIAANCLFHWEASQGAYVAQGYGFRLGLASALILVALIGGRILPAFTRNWLMKQGETQLPTAPMQIFDKVALLALVVSLVVWVIEPLSITSGFAFIVVSALHTARLWRWKGAKVRSEALLWALHAAYAFIPLGAFIEGLSILRPDLLGTASALHVWMIGAIGLMSLVVMIRATLGHTGRTLTASTATTALFWMLALAVCARLVAGFWPAASSALYAVAGIFWLGSFAGFILIYGPKLLRPKVR